MNFPKGARVYFDTDIWIYLAEGHERLAAPIAELANILLTGDVIPVASTLSWGECLIKPIQRDDQEGINGFNEMFSGTEGLEVVELSREVIWRASNLRGKTKLHFADALHLAAAQQANCQIYLTNDKRLVRERYEALVPPLQIQRFG